MRGRIGIGIGMWGAAALSLTSDVPLSTRAMEDPVDCVTGSPMADTQVRQVFLGDDGVKPSRDTQQTLLHPEEYKFLWTRAGIPPRR